MAKKNSKGFDLKKALRAKPINLALSFGLAATVEVYLLSYVATRIFSSEEIVGGRIAMLAMTLIPVWVIAYVIVSLIIHKN
ncbi:MAG TPA: hypothetical protein VJB90_05650 [Candidatus Nanoarchaeia archaeon]|nr:hypothetical protein [Candidatus Nanoarchaeia archaeon]